MANQKDKFGIFLTVVILILVVAAGVYAFIYREKIAETIQRFTKKDNKEVYEIRTTKKSLNSKEEFSGEKKSKEEDLVFNEPPLEKKKQETPPLFEPTDSSSNLKEKEKKSRTGSPPLSEPEEKFLDPADSPYKKTTKLSKASEEEELHSEFVGTTTKRKHKIKKGKRHSSKAHRNLTSSKTTLEKRVRELEEKFGVRPKRRSNLEKRISRLEKLEKRVSKLEKIASKQDKEKQ